VLVNCWQRAYGSNSQVPVQMDYVVISTVEHGLVTRAEFFTDRAAGYVAAGLSE
jgi:hypothetical protein